MKKSVFLLISVMFFFIFSTPVFSGNIDDCKVLRVGPYPSLADAELNRGENVVFLSHPTAWPGQRFFILSSNLGNKGLATFLTAMALEKTVYVRIEDPQYTAGSLISIVYANSW